MDTEIKTRVEKTFLSLPREERESIISHGTALRLFGLRKRLFLAEGKVRHFEEKYQVALAQLDADGLPDDADYEIHEDYIMWHHWAAVADEIKKNIASLEEIAQQGLYKYPSSYSPGELSSSQACGAKRVNMDSRGKTSEVLPHASVLP